MSVPASLSGLPTVSGPEPEQIRRMVCTILDDDQADDPVVIDIAGRSSIADYIVVASGRNARHVGTMAQHLREQIKATGIPVPEPEGLPYCDWVVVDAGDVIVHLFRPEVRTFYALEKMWTEIPAV